MGSARCWRIGRLGRVRRVRGRFSRRRRVLLRLGVCYFLDAMDVLVRNFPAEITALAALFNVLLEENGASGIGGKQARSGQQDIAHTILHGDLAAEKLRIRRHSSEFVGG